MMTAFKSNAPTRFQTSLLTAGFAILCVTAAGVVPVAQLTAEQPTTKTATAVRVERGAYLVNSMGCHDCHTPWKMGPKGPEPDMSLALTGHPESVVMPPPPQLPKGPWIGLMSATNTAWAGPWGVSFTANLTPDKETGLGDWTEEQFIGAMRTGRHQGKGRPILPPMPAQMIARLHDEDLKSVFAYLQSLKPVRNRVPAPVDPPDTSER
jgi:mono/diheme cytochrome c family protein